VPVSRVEGGASQPCRRLQHHPPVHMHMACHSRQPVMASRICWRGQYDQGRGPEGVECACVDGGARSKGRATMTNATIPVMKLMDAKAYPIPLTCTNAVLMSSVFSPSPDRTKIHITHMDEVTCHDRQHQQAGRR
jgi:hypothetical protein